MDYESETGLAQALEFNADQAQKAAGATVVEVPDPRRYAIAINGQLVERDMPLPGRRLHQMDTIGDLVSIAVKHKAESIWHDHQHVVAVFDEKEQCHPDRRTQAVLTLKHADVLQIVSGWPTTYDQQSLILLLKRKLRDTLNVNLLEAIRTLKFRKLEQSHGSVNHQDNKLGADVEMGVTGGDAIPEDFTVTTQIYVNAIPEFTTEIACDVNLDLQRQCIELATVGDELESAIDGAQFALRELLETHLGAQEADIPVYAGRPA